MKFGPDHSVFHRGYTSGMLFIILRGEVDLVHSSGGSCDEESIVTLSTGNYFGENSLIRVCILKLCFALVLRYD